MSKSKRFLNLEHSPVLKVFKKNKISFERFDRLEVGKHTIRVEISKSPQKETYECPECKKKISNDKALTCYYCGSTLKDRASHVEGSDLKTWEKRCPGCAAICNVNQDHCIRCGWRLNPWTKEESDQQALLTTADGREIVVTIDGVVYRSGSRNLPAHIRELMEQIQKEGYSESLIQEWVKKRNAEIAANLAILSEKSQQRRQEDFIFSTLDTWGLIRFIAGILALLIMVSTRIFCGR